MPSSGASALIHPQQKSKIFKFEDRGLYQRNYSLQKHNNDETIIRKEDNNLQDMPLN